MAGLFTNKALWISTTVTLSQFQHVVILCLGSFKVD